MTTGTGMIRLRGSLESPEERKQLILAVMRARKRIWKQEVYLA